MVEHPEIDGKLQRSFIRVRALINLNDPLIDEILVPREGRDPARMKVKYEGSKIFAIHVVV